MGLISQVPLGSEGGICSLSLPNPSRCGTILPLTAARSIAMTVPDNELIAEVLLLSEGFTTAKDLARKLTALFTLSRELLSPQQHYDWGLRALKTSLGIAGRELREVRGVVGWELGWGEKQDRS